ncbi:MAG TPA: cytochrome c [Flavisolibacter sp.]|nr:cytochrome c [Flavisolibacter sp.]
MKRILIAAGVFSLALGFVSCGGAKGDDPGHAYMPDMYYSRAYETYGYNDVEGEFDSLKRRGINYTGVPVPGTVARGEMISYHLTNDSAGLAAANSLKNPLDSMAATKAAMKEAERLYLIYCGVCHGDKLDGNGPLPAGGAYAPVPANFTAPNIKAFSDGHYYHVITYGIRTMGSYASQLTPEERWWVIKYIRSKQGGGSAADSTATKAATDSTKK